MGESKASSTEMPEKPASPVERLVMHDYILGLSRPVSVDDMKPLIGEKIPIRSTQTEWGKVVVVADSIEVTSVNFDIDVATELSKGQVRIYSNYYLGSDSRYNAWNTLERIQDYIKNYLEA